MLTREVAAQAWQAFFDEFSKSHPGTKATVQVIGQDLGAQEEARERLFVGISYEVKGSERGSISILLGTEPEDHAEHRIEHPTHVWLLMGDAGEGDAIAIEAADNTRTILEMQPLPALPE